MESVQNVFEKLDEDLSVEAFGFEGAFGEIPDPETTAFGGPVGQSGSLESTPADPITGQAATLFFSDLETVAHLYQDLRTIESKIASLKVQFNQLSVRYDMETAHKSDDLQEADQAIADRTKALERLAAEESDINELHYDFTLKNAGALRRFLNFILFRKQSIENRYARWDARLVEIREDRRRLEKEQQVRQREAGVMRGPINALKQELNTVGEGLARKQEAAQKLEAEIDNQVVIRLTLISGDEREALLCRLEPHVSDPPFFRYCVKRLLACRTEESCLSMELEEAEVRCRKAVQAAGDGVSQVCDAVVRHFQMDTRREQVQFSLEGRVSVSESGFFRSSLSGSAVGSGQGSGTYTLQEPRWMDGPAFRHSINVLAEACSARGEAEERVLYLNRQWEALKEARAEAVHAIRWELENDANGVAS